MGAIVSIVIASLLAALSLYLLLTTLRGLPCFRSLPRVDQPRPPLSVCIVSPACDEADTIVSATRSMLATGVEVVVVDDRSKDATGALLDDLARTEARLRVVHLTSLPQGWLGKVRALHQGAAAAETELLLFADADAHLAEDALHRAVALMQDEGLDFLSLVPRIGSAGFWADTVFALLQASLSSGTRVWAIERDDPRAFGATGAFMLVRRAALERTEGFEWLRMEVSDDFGLSLLIKRHGGRCALLSGVDALSLDWYRSLGEMARRTQKNFYAITGRCQPWRCYLQAGAFLALGLSPLGLLFGGAASLVAAGGAAALITAAVLCAVKFRRPLAPALAVHLGAVITAYMVARAGWIGGRINGVEWRGVHYSAAEINAGRRVLL